MNNSLDLYKEAQKFFKDKIHALNNAISHESDPDKIQKLESLLRYAEDDWKKYTSLINERDSNDLLKEEISKSNSLHDIQYCKQQFWLL